MVKTVEKYGEEGNSELEKTLISLGSIGGTCL